MDLETPNRMRFEIQNLKNTELAINSRARLLVTVFLN